MNECENLKVSKNDLDCVNSQTYNLSTCHENIGNPYKILLSLVSARENYLID